MNEMKKINAGKKEKNPKNSKFSFFLSYFYQFFHENFLFNFSFLNPLHIFIPNFPLVSNFQMSSESTNSPLPTLISSGIEEISGNLLNFRESTDCIVQQINAISKFPKGLAASIEKEFPHGRIYSKNPSANRPMGELILTFPDKNNNSSMKGPAIANLVGQISPGKPGDYSSRYKISSSSSSSDSAELRLVGFRSALTKFLAQAKIHQWKRILFPYKIGCGLAGGQWEHYLPLIQEFYEKIKENQLETKIFIVKMEENFNGGKFNGNEKNQRKRERNFNLNSNEIEEKIFISNEKLKRSKELEKDEEN